MCQREAREYQATGEKKPAEMTGQFSAADGMCQPSCSDEETEDWAFWEPCWALWRVAASRGSGQRWSVPLELQAECREKGASPGPGAALLSSERTP